MHLYIEASRANDVQQKTGVEFFARHIIEALMDVMPNTVRVTLLSKLPLDEGWPELPKHWNHITLNWPFPAWTTLRLSWFCKSLPKSALLYIPSSQPPLIHPKLVATIHDCGWIDAPDAYSLKNRIFQHIATKRIVINAQCITVPTAYVQNQLINKYSADPEKIAIIPNASKAPQIQHIDKTDTLVYIGRIETKKNVIQIVKAFEIIKSQPNFQEYKLLLAGKDGFGANDIKEYITASQYKNDIIIKGYISEQEKWKLLQQAKIFLFPSVTEGFGIPILEAIDMNTPVIASDIPVHRELQVEGVMFVNPQCTRDWAHAIQKTLQSYRSTKLHHSYSWEHSAQLWWEKVSTVYNKTKEV